MTRFQHDQMLEHILKNHISLNCTANSSFMIWKYQHLDDIKDVDA